MGNSVAAAVADNVLKGWDIERHATMQVICLDMDLESGIVFSRSEDCVA